MGNIQEEIKENNVKVDLMRWYMMKRLNNRYHIDEIRSDEMAYDEEIKQSVKDVTLDQATEISILKQTIHELQTLFIELGADFTKLKSKQRRVEATLERNDLR